MACVTSVIKNEGPLAFYKASPAKAAGLAAEGDAPTDFDACSLFR